MTETVFRLKRHLTSFQIMILGFAGVILLGALVLMLPIATVQRVWTPFHEALFTSTSAVCVTGLVVQDTGSYWSAFGQTVILLLIQIGGLGVITGAVTFLMLAGRNITLKERSAMQDAISAPAVGGIVRLTRFILKGTFLVELLGALALLPAFCRDYGLRGVWMSVFHSVSAFCNAGFDILGRTDSFYPSLTAYAADPLVNIVIMLLIIVGGIGFLTWDDVCTHGLHLRRYRMQSKVILSATALLITIPAVLFYLTDFADLPVGERILASLFQSVTPRTAGYNTVDLTEMTDASQAVTILLMLTGGAPGSTAGGNGVGNVFHQDGLTGFGLCHNQGTLALTDGGKQVYDTGRHRVGVSTFAKLELLVREEGGEVLERYAVAYESRVTSVYFGYFYQREVLFAFFRGTDYAFYHITGFQAEQFDL